MKYFRVFYKNEEGEESTGTRVTIHKKRFESHFICIKGGLLGAATAANAAPRNGSH